MRLQTRYTCSIAGLIIFVGLVLAVLFQWNFRETLHNLTDNTHKQMRQALLDQMLQRSRAVSLILAENLVNPIYNYNIKAIGELLFAAKAQQDVGYVHVFDATGNIIHDGENGIPKFGERAIDPERLKLLYTKRLPRLTVGRERITAETAVFLGDVPIGGVKMSISLASVEADIRQTISENTILGKAARRRVLTMTAVTTGLLLLVGALSAALIARRLTRPINDIAHAAFRVGRGDLSGRLSIARNDEIGTLARIFNQMASELEHQKKKLLNANIALEDRVQERTEAVESAYTQLNEAHSQLFQSGKLASIGELAAGVAHELNQPLMVIRATAQMVKRQIRGQGLDNETGNQKMQTIERNTKRMMVIINHLRTFSRQSPRKFESVDLNQVVEDGKLMFSEQFRLHNIALTQNLAPDLPEVWGDANQLEQVILNLATNARDAIEKRRQQGDDFKRPANGGQDTVTIATRELKGCKEWVELVVADTGGGISDEIRKKIFDPFYTTKPVGQGTGLGLSISYGIIGNHNGEIKIERTGPEGTHFSVKLPQSAAAADGQA